MNRSPLLRIGTRASALARWQAEWVAEQLREAGAAVELIPITTEGDVKSGPLGQIGGQGLFTKRIQEALLLQQIDLAVHSLKDLPTEPVEGLQLTAVPPRAEVRDALLSHQATRLQDLPHQARVGTGSMRRRAQLLHARDDLEILEIRGNVDTRLKKLDDEQYDAIILAVAGLGRLGLDQRITQTLPTDLMMPAVGQGALGLETRAGDEQTEAVVMQLDDLAAHAAVLAERSMLATLRGGCLAPVGAWARMEGDQLVLEGVVLSEDGVQRLHCRQYGSPDKPVSLGETVAQTLIDQGGDGLVRGGR